MYRSRLISLLFAFAFGLGVFPLACGSNGVTSPFGPGAGGAGGSPDDPGAAGFRLDIDAGDEVDPTLGGPCEDDGQCNDEVECTLDTCDEALGRCRFQPEDANCNDRVYCDGALRCDVRAGCVPGEPVACSDNDTCTIDVCVEATQSCRHDPRDADGDGDPTRNCGGEDCDDQDPLVSSQATEVCGNAKDDDCDGSVDEKDCVAPEHDTCESALTIDADGFYDLDLTATALDYPNDCVSAEKGYRDVVAVVTVPDGEPRDIDVIAKLDRGSLVLGSADTCGALASAECQPSFTSPAGGTVNRLLLRAKPPGNYPIYVQADSEATVQIYVERRLAEPHTPDRCEQALALSDGGEAELVRLPAYDRDFDTECGAQTGDAFFTFSLAEPRDVTIVAEAQLDLGEPVLALLDAGCRGGERTCRKSQPGRLFERNLPPGTYRVAVSGTAPDDVSVRLETEPVSEAPPGEGCDDALPLTPGVEQVVDLSEHEDAVHPACRAGAPDVTFELDLPAKRDVALIGRFSSGDAGAVSLTDASCAESQACVTGGGTLRAIHHGLAAGTYRAVIESARGNPVGLSYFERTPKPTVFVPLADDCDSVVDVPETGGRFMGNTTNAFPDFEGGCDVGGQQEGGAPDQVLRLRLEKDTRVILDMQGSNFATMLSVRRGEFCPGAELPRACAPGYWAERSYLDLDLSAGDYFILVDGYDGAAGAWNLEVFTAPL